MRLLLSVILLTMMTAAASAQPNQIEGKIVYHPNLEKLSKADGYGGGLELTTSLGEHIKLLQQLDIEKSRQGDSLRSLQQRDITLQSTIRLYPVDGYASFKPFVQGGVRARFNRLNSAVAIPLPGHPGALKTENKFTFASPFIGAGVNYKDYYILEYSYLLPDFASELSKNIITGQPDQTFYRERGHFIRAKAFLPVSDKFSFNPSYQVYRRETDGMAPIYDQSLAFGLAYKFGKSTN